MNYSLWQVEWRWLPQLCCSHLSGMLEDGFSVAYNRARFRSDENVRVSGETEVYIRGDRSLGLHFCRYCGCVSHWRALTADETVGIVTSGLQNQRQEVAL